MEPNMKRYQEMYSSFLSGAPFREEDIVDYVPMHAHGIRVYIRDGAQVDYNHLSRTYQYRDPEKVAKRSSVDITDEICREIIASNLIEYMRIRNISRQELSDRTGLSLAALSKYITKKATPTATTLKKLAQSLGCHYSELLE